MILAGSETQATPVPAAEDVGARKSLHHPKDAKACMFVVVKAESSRVMRNTQEVEVCVGVCVCVGGGPQMSADIAQLQMRV